MSLEDWKAAYRQLDPVHRKELARWIVEQELGGTGGPVGGAVAVPTATPGWIRTLGVVLVVGLVGGLLVWQGLAWKQRQASERARMTAAQREAEEAAKPRSPKNLDFLRSQVGKTITISGVPESAEVGFLHFSRQRNQALRLNLMPGGVVLMQSSELEELVHKKTTVTVTGTVELAEDGVLEIKVLSLGQLRRSP